MQQQWFSLRHWWLFLLFLISEPLSVQWKTILFSILAYPKAPVLSSHLNHYNSHILFPICMYESICNAPLLQPKQSGVQTVV